MSSRQAQVPCLHCKSLIPENQLKQHSKAAHQIDSFQCQVCKNYLGSCRALEIHQTTEHPVKPQKKN